jgi:hypothetical protein
MVNIIDGRQGRFVRAYVSTLGQVFDHIYVAPIGGDLGTVARQTFVIVAAQRPMPIGDDVISEDDSSSLHSAFLSEAEWQDYLGQETGIILTDDFVPVDNLLAPVFSDSGL